MCKFTKKKYTFKNGAKKGYGKIIILLYVLTTFHTNKVSAMPKVQPDFIITQEMIDEATPTPALVHFTKRIEHDIRVMEKRHFENIDKESEDKYRIARLEFFLLGKTWEFSPLQDRMRRLRLASQRKMLSGTSLPVGIRRYVSPARIQNDSTPSNDTDDNVGLIDGFLKLYAPEAYEKWSIRKRRLQECYNDG